MRVVGNQFAALCVARLGMRHNIGIAVDAQDLSPATTAATAAAFQRIYLVRAGVVEIEHVIRLALEEQGRVAVGLQLEAVPEVGALAGAVPVAAHKIGIAVQRLRRPFLQQVALVIEPVKLRREPAANGDLVRRTLLPAESPAAATPTLGSCTRSRPTRSCPTRSRPTRSCPTRSCRIRRLQAGRRCASSPRRKRAVSPPIRNRLRSLRVRQDVPAVICCVWSEMFCHRMSPFCALYISVPASLCLTTRD